MKLLFDYFVIFVVLYIIFFILITIITITDLFNRKESEHAFGVTMNKIVNIFGCTFVFYILFRLAFFIFCTPIMLYNTIAGDPVTGWLHVSVTVIAYVISLISSSLLVHKIWKGMD